MAHAEQRGLVLSGEQADALAHVTDGRDLGVVVGYAVTGKSAMLGVAREAWESAGYEVRGAALSGIAAENLESGSGIASRTIASMEHGWVQGRDMLTSRDALVIDEAGSYVALSRHRDGVDLHYGRDDFASQDKLIDTLSRDRAKDMASDYKQQMDPDQSYAERRGITFRERMERVVEIVRQVPEKMRRMFDGLHLDTDGAAGSDAAQRPERKVEEDTENALRRARRQALIRHARASDTTLTPSNRVSRLPTSSGVSWVRHGALSMRSTPMAGRMRKPPTARTTASPARREPAGSTAPFPLFNSKPKSAQGGATITASHPLLAPTVSWNAGRSLTRPASASMQPATILATGLRARRWATWR
ncbi:hypothetical protein BKD02_12420 [Brucella sp. 09RB8910]|nr:hypothetical protein BKD02_12420 [Brucella sp. 09RB8910]